MYLLTFIGMLVYSFTLNLGHMWVVFLTAAILGYVPMNRHHGEGIRFFLSVYWHVGHGGGPAV